MGGSTGRTGVVVFALLVAGCGGGDGDDVPDAGTTMTLSGQVYSSEPNCWEETAVGVECCWIGPSGPLCTNTKTGGYFSILDIPKGETGFLRIDEAGYATNILMTTPDQDTNIGEMCPVSQTVVEKWYEDAAQTMSSGKATVAVQVLLMPDWSQAVGATVALDPASGSGPYYTASDDWETLDDMAEATTNSAFGVFLNVDPGEVTASAVDPTYVCDTNGFAGSLPAPMPVDDDGLFCVVAGCRHP